MKSQRVALVTGFLALGVAACGDDVQIVEPTPPPPPPLVVSMSPQSATVEIGGTVNFAVQASGGGTGIAATWTCASSNTGVATTSGTATGCAATGVAAGGVTITAAITKGGETSNAASSLDVVAEMTGDPAFILIGSDYGWGHGHFR